MKASGLAGLRGLDHRRVILRAERVGFVVDQFETGGGKELPADVGGFDAVLVGHVDHSDFIAHLAAVSQLLEDVNDGRAVLRGRAVGEEQSRIFLDQLPCPNR